MKPGVFVVALVATVALLLTGACGALGSDASKCTPACSSTQACCEEPNHAVSDGGVGKSWVCVTPSGAACPALP